MHLILILISLIGLLQLSAQSVLSGYIRDAATGENLIGATIIDIRSGKGALANTFGYYSLSLDGDSAQLQISYVGYERQIVSVPLLGAQALNFSLVADSQLKEVIVSGEERLDLVPTMSTVKLSMEQINNLPATMGESDIMKAIQLMPGISAGAEGSANVHVRGGGPDQNLVMLDGVPLYNPAHLYGFFSVFNPDAINNVEVIKGGFPARYGGRLSSVIDVSMKEGNTKEFGGSLTVGPLASKLSLEGPIWKERTSFIVSGRRSYIGLLYNPFNRFGDEYDIAQDYYFYDFNAKLNHAFSDRSRLYVSLYKGMDDFSSGQQLANTDNFKSEEASTMQWGNGLAVVRWNFVPHPKVFTNISVSTTDFHFRTEQMYTTTETVNTNTTTRNDQIVYRNRISDQTVKLEVDYYPMAGHAIKTGGWIIRHQYAPGLYRLAQEASNLQTNGGAEQTDATEYAAYLEDDIQVSRRLRLNLGVHQAVFVVDSTSYGSTQPRISGRFSLAKGLAVKASYAKMAQFHHLLTNSGVGLPTDLWVPTTRDVKPQTADQWALGLARTTPGWELSVEAYIKEMNNLLEYEEGTSLTGTYRPWYERVTQGDGTSKGLEFLIEKKTGRFTGWISYTLSKTQRQFDDLNEGVPFFSRYDRRHDMSVTGTHTFGKKWSISAIWILSSGNRATIITSSYGINLPGQSGNESIGYIYSDRNAYVLPTYHRLDLSIKWESIGEKVGHSVVLGVYNAYARDNAFYLNLNLRQNENITYYPKSLLPTIPYVNYTLKF